MAKKSAGVNDMNSIMNKLIPVLAVILGIAFMVVGFVQYANRDKYDTTVTAKIVDITEEWETATAEDEMDRLVKTAYIDYEVNGVKYEHVLAPVQSDSYSVGDSIEILCQSKNPEKISDVNVAKTSLIFVGMGAIATLVGVIMTIKAFKVK